MESIAVLQIPTMHNPGRCDHSDHLQALLSL